jgi:hypothetical protein
MYLPYLHPCSVALHIALIQHFVRLSKTKILAVAIFVLRSIMLGASLVARSRSYAEDPTVGPESLAVRYKSKKKNTGREIVTVSNWGMTGTAGALPWQALGIGAEL